MTANGKKIALITGITGQDGSYLAELLLSKGYQVNGIIRRSSSFNTGRIDHIFQDPHEQDYQFRLWYGDLADSGAVIKLLAKTQPDEIYNLAAQSHVRVSFEIPEYTANIVGLGTLRLLDAVHSLGLSTKFYQGSSSEMFGATPPPQKEDSMFLPRSPYAAAKVFAHHMAINYREAYGIFSCAGILFNHESPRRGETFVTKKITRAIAKILAKRQEKLYLGNLEARRDWGYAPEYVEGMWRMLQQDKPDDYVLATGEAHSVQEFLEAAFTAVGLDWRMYVEVDQRYFRPTEVEHLIGNPRKAKEVLGWSAKVTFKDLVQIMLIDDLKKEGLDPTIYELPGQHPLASRLHELVIS